MVITIEPGKSAITASQQKFVTNILEFAGIYVPPTPNFPKFFHNLGIRIEVCSNQSSPRHFAHSHQDEILVGDKHPTILSVAAPKEVSLVPPLLEP
jgi:hypothetical protein